MRLQPTPLPLRWRPPARPHSPALGPRRSVGASATPGPRVRLRLKKRPLPQSPATHRSSLPALRNLHLALGPSSGAPAGPPTSRLHPHRRPWHVGRRPPPPSDRARCNRMPSRSDWRPSTPRLGPVALGPRVLARRARRNPKAARAPSRRTPAEPGRRLRRHAGRRSVHGSPGTPGAWPKGRHNRGLATPHRHARPWRGSPARRRHRAPIPRGAAAPRRAGRPGRRRSRTRRWRCSPRPAPPAPTCSPSWSSP
mmetsp:Transcript_10043/g.35009  ORF Transcript_10043/g.35009 Transcript_10043/m.35009 type:complete len:253 (+) Transcript_10043:2928-3686(+)